jgi:hypothetical protein
MEEIKENNNEEKREESSESVKNFSENSVLPSVPQKKIEEAGPSFTDKMRDNPWMLSTVVLGLITLIFIFGSFSNGGVTGNVISADDAADQLLDFYESNGAQGLTLDSVEEASGVYMVNFEYQGSIVPIAVTKDGKFAGALNSISTSDSSSDSNTQTSDIPKTERPDVKLYVWSYCPYGVQAQGPVADVASLLEDYADFTIVPYYDGHGEYENQQNKIQSCIQELEPAKYWDYASSFVEDIYPNCGSTRDVNCNEEESVVLMNSLGIDSDAVLACVESQGDDLFSAAADDASSSGVTGSPTIIINGVKANVARNAESIKSAVCETFTDGSAPEECGETLDASAAAAAGNC